MADNTDTSTTSPQAAQPTPTQTTEPVERSSENKFIFRALAAFAILILLTLGYLWVVSGSDPCQTKCGIESNIQTVTPVGQDQLMPITTDHSDVVFQIVTDFGTTARAEAAANGDLARSEALKEAQNNFAIAELELKIERLERQIRQEGLCISCGVQPVRSTQPATATQCGSCAGGYPVKRK